MCYGLTGFKYFLNRKNFVGETGLQGVMYDVPCIREVIIRFIFGNKNCDI